MNRDIMYALLINKYKLVIYTIFHICYLAWAGQEQIPGLRRRIAYDYKKRPASFIEK